jgi:HK97 family phage prohead protease
MSELIYKTVKSEVSMVDAAEGIVEAYVNSMGVVDHDGEIIELGAFDQSIQKGGQSVAWFHDQSAPVGKVIDAAPIQLSQDDETARQQGRLKAVMQFNLNTQRGREAFADVEFGSVKEWSVGFRALEDDLERLDGGENVRVIKNLDWVEVSPVLRGASPDTQTITAKSASDTTPEEPDVASDTEIEKMRVSVAMELLKLDITKAKSNG